MPPGRTPAARGAADPTSKHARGLPPWRRVLAVVAHPDDESFGLGAILGAFVVAGADVSVLCLTHGEASALHGVPGDLARVRADELAAAARVLGVGRVRLLGHPDSRLADVPLRILVDDVRAFADTVDPDGIVVFDADGVTAHPDHRRATEAALAVADAGALGVLAWAIPADVAVALNAELGTTFVGHEASEVDLAIDVDRTTQREAVACHPSQAVPGSALWRRLDLLGPSERMRWLRRPPGSRQATAADARAAGSARPAGQEGVADPAGPGVAPVAAGSSNQKTAP